MKKTLLFVSTWALSAPLPAADFLTVYRAASENDAVIAEARARLDAARERLPQGRAGLLPSVSLSANTTYNDEELDNRTRHRTDDWHYNSNGVTLSLSQPLFHWQNWVGYDQSKLVVAQAETVYASAQQDLILRAAQAYFDVLQAKADLGAATAYRSAVASQLDIARQAFEIGTGINTDVHDAETRYAAASREAIAAETELDIRLRALEVIAGTLPLQLADSLIYPDLTPPSPLDLNSWVEAARKGNLKVQEQQLAAEVARREVDRQRAAHLPTLDLVLSSGHTSSLSSGDREVTDRDQIGLQLSVPLYQGGAVVSRTREAAANLSAAMATRDSALRGATLAAHQAYLGVVNGLLQIDTTQDGLQAAQKAVTSNKDAYDLGVRLNIDVLNAQSQVFQAQRELNRVSVGTLLAQLRLKAAVGALDESDVTALDALFEVAQN